MNKIKSWVRNEPVVTRALLTLAAIAVAIFGEQTVLQEAEHVSEAVTAVGVIWAALGARNKVTPTQGDSDVE